MGVTPHNFKHFSFLYTGHKIEAIGWNKPNKTHPTAFRFKYRFNAIHSELDVINNFRKPISELKRFGLLNIRLDNRGNVRLSKPCRICQHLLAVFKTRNVCYSITESSYGHEAISYSI